jgi:hypothetical protein
VEIEMAGSRAITICGTAVCEPTGAAIAVVSTAGTTGAVAVATEVNGGEIVGERSAKYPPTTTAPTTHVAAHDQAL